MTTIAERICQPIAAQGGLPGNAFGVLGTGWMELTFLAMLVSLFSLAAIYMFASFLRNQQLLVWTKFELFQILATAVIVAFIVLWVVGMCTFDMGFLSNRYASVIQGQPTNMYQIIDKYFDRMEVLGYYIYGWMMYVTKVMTFLAKTTMLSNPLGVGSQENPLESLGQVSSLLFYMLSGFAISFLLMGMQMRMLEYLALATLYYMLPFGIFFRAFEPTRKFGGTLIGLSLTMLLFYPIILVFNDAMMFDQVNQDTAALQVQLQNANSKIQGNKLPTGTSLTTDIPGLKDQTEFQSFTSGISGAPLFLMRPMMTYFIGAGALPIINFIVLVSIARALTQMFGEEIDVSNLTRLI